MIEGNFVGIYKVIFFNVRKECPYKKGNILKVNMKDNDFQISLFTDKQVFHNNISEVDLMNNINELMDKYFFQCEIYVPSKIYSFRITNKGKLLSNSRLNSESFEISSHNKEKNYLLKEGMIVPPLIDLGVITEEGKVVRKYYDKFKQINRFLEIIEDSIKDEKKLNIVDFGCGKSYLSFILYYYLKEIKKIDVKMTGLDLKEEVIKNCNLIKDKYGYSNMDFFCGDIANYKPDENIDMIITLHACDTATDYALFHAIKLKVKYIFSVPCCQHEINLQMTSKSFESISKYGILKERFSAMLTDSFRANLLEYSGYKVQVMEFIDMIHSPKNLLIRAFFTGNYSIDSLNLVEEELKKFGVSQTLYKLIKEN